MSKLISGKDALIALGTDESIQFRRNMDWNDFDLNNTFGLKISDFKDPNIQFRLKPKTITINGVEVSEKTEFQYRKGGKEVLIKLINDEDTERLIRSFNN